MDLACGLCVPMAHMSVTHSEKHLEIHPEILQHPAHPELARSQSGTLLPLVDPMVQQNPPGFSGMANWHRRFRSIT